MTSLDVGGAVLCGGQSRRMGRSKAWLPFGGEPLLTRALRRLGEVASPLLVVAAPGQRLPALPEAVEVFRDPVESRGPLQGIAVALEALAGRTSYAYVTATDAPFLAPAFVRRMRALAEGRDACVVRDGGHHHPLSAVFATRLGATAHTLLDANRRRPYFLFEESDTRFVEREELLADPSLRRADPNLWTLRNLNTPEDYRAALRDAGLATPPPNGDPAR